MNEVERERRITEIEQLITNTKQNEYFGWEDAFELIAIARKAEAERRTLSMLGEAATIRSALGEALENATLSYGYSNITLRTATGQLLWSQSQPCGNRLGEILRYAAMTKTEAVSA